METMLWLTPLWRSTLFVALLSSVSILFYRLVITPVLRLYKLKGAISYEEASNIIGSHFTSIDDRLLNLVQLQSATQKSDLLEASILQKSKLLSSLPFYKAVNYKTSLRSASLVALPLLLFIIAYFSGNIKAFAESYNRVINFQQSFQPPPPFVFQRTSDSLVAIAGQPFLVEVNVVGTVVPSDPKIEFSGQSYYLNQESANRFSFLIPAQKNNLSFRFMAQEFSSPYETLRVITPPNLMGFSMTVDPPSYTKLPKTVTQNTGRVVVPEGSKVSWLVEAINTDIVLLSHNEDSIFFQEKSSIFSASNIIRKEFPYTLHIGNRLLPNHERINNTIAIIKDAKPLITVTQIKDENGHPTPFFAGQSSDDYGITSLSLVYYNSNTPNVQSRVPLALLDDNLHLFKHHFRADTLSSGQTFHMYFEAFDNDAVNGPKSSKTALFTFSNPSMEMIENQNFNSQNNLIDSYQKALIGVEENQKNMNQLSRSNTQAPPGFKQLKKLQSILDSQEKQYKSLESYNQAMQETLKDKTVKSADYLPEKLLKNRLQQNTKALQDQKALLDQLREVSQKINKENFSEKLRKIANQNKSSTRSLKQLLELTKRYFVSSKTAQLSRRLSDLSKAQDQLSKSPTQENNLEAQEKLNKIFNQIKEELQNTLNENNALIDPFDLQIDPKYQNNATKAQDEATQILSEPSSDSSSNDTPSPSKSQSKAARNIMQMSQQLQQASSFSSKNQMAEDIEALRQILDNLVLFSFDLEKLLLDIQNLSTNSSSLYRPLLKQKLLIQHFEHIDDSLFALSMRQPLISERINNELSSVDYNMHKAIDLLEDAFVYKGAAAQQYALTSTNNIADLLSDTLSNLQAQMNPSSGQGSPEMQLPDIIMSQQGIGKQAKKSQGPSQQDSDKPGNKPTPGTPSSPYDSESQSEEVFDIYKQQQRLRLALQNLIGKAPDRLSKSVLDQMKRTEDELIRNGLTPNVVRQLSQLKHQLLKLDRALIEQNRENRRESQSSQKSASGSDVSNFNNLPNYMINTEILNKQPLPLHPVYKSKIRAYFNIFND